MVKIIEATYDGLVLRPDEPLLLEANTRVRVTVETVESENGATTSFLKTARSLKLDGPADWANKVDDYLYGEHSEQTG